MNKVKSLLDKWTQMSLMLRIVIGLLIGAALGLLLPVGGVKKWKGGLLEVAPLPKKSYIYE